MTPFHDLVSEETRTRDLAVDTILGDHKSVIDKLIPLVDPANAAKYSDETRCIAAYLLGELRAVESVPVLSKALANPPGQKDTSDVSRYDTPIFTALLKIGRPCITAMIENLENSDNPTLNKNSLDVLLHVLGGKTRLLEVLSKLHDRAVKENRPAIIARRISQAQSWTEEHYRYTRGSGEPLY